MKKKTYFFHGYLPASDQLLTLQSSSAAEWITEVLQYWLTQSPTVIWLAQNQHNLFFLWSHFLFSSVLLHFSPSALRVSKDVSLVLEISIPKTGNDCLGVGVHCMTMRLSNLGETLVFKKPQTFMDEKGEAREVDKVLQALPEILNLHWDVLFILCAEFIYVPIWFLFRYMVPKKEAICGHSGRARAWQSYVIHPLQILSFQLC